MYHRAARDAWRESSLASSRMEGMGDATVWRVWGQGVRQGGFGAIPAAGRQSDGNPGGRRG
jgi:hypothetical protein